MAVVGDARIVSLVGAGGKKTTLYALARALPGRVAVSSTSHMAAYDTSVVDEVVVVNDAGQGLLPPSRGRIVAFGGAANDSNLKVMSESLECMKLLLQHYQSQWFNVFDYNIQEFVLQDSSIHREQVHQLLQASNQRSHHDLQQSWISNR